MAEWFWIGVHGLGVVTAVSPIALGIGSAIFDGLIRPWLVPTVDIERLADDIIARHPVDPETASLIEEHAAWCRGLSAEQGEWRRVRKAIRRRRLTGEIPVR